MGSQHSRENSEGTDLLIHRCPGRNRSLGNSTSKDTNSKRVSRKRDVNINVISYKKSENDLAQQNQRSRTENEIQLKSKSIGVTKKKRQRFFRNDVNLSETENLMSCEKKLKYRKRKIGKPKKTEQEQQNYELIMKIFETLTELEATFLEEKKYENRLFTAVGTQIQEIQRFSVLLEKERTQNKKLLALLDCTHETNEHDYVTKDRTAESFGKRMGQQLDKRKIYSRNLSESLSPLVLQQQCDELTANLNHCRAELSNKNKEFNLLQFKVEELQGNCESLQKELQDSCNCINNLNCDIAALKQERKHLKRTLRSFSQTERDNGSTSDKSYKKTPHELQQKLSDPCMKVLCVKAKAE